jgi:hypothetical protein
MPIALDFDNYFLGKDFVPDSKRGFDRDIRSLTPPGNNFTIDYCRMPILKIVLKRLAL